MRRKKIMRKIINAIFLTILTSVVIFTGCTKSVTTTNTGADESKTLGSFDWVEEIDSDSKSIQSTDVGLDKTILTLSNLPSVNQIVDLRLSVEVLNSGFLPVNNIWIEFERYDPALYYPLGKGSDKDEALQVITELAEKSENLALQLSNLSKNQPTTLIPSEQLVVVGSFNWQGTPLSEGDNVQLSGKILFPEEGEWLINTRFQTDYGFSYLRTSLKLTVTQDSGAEGWVKTYEPDIAYTILDEDNPFCVQLFIPEAPKTNEKAEVYCELLSISDMEDVSVQLTVRLLKKGGWKREEISIDRIFVEGDSIWQGNLKANMPLRFSTYMILPESGDWEIEAYGTSKSETYDSGAWLFLHTEMDKGRIGWVESHERDQEIPEEKYEG